MALHAHSTHIFILEQRFVGSLYYSWLPLRSSTHSQAWLAQGSLLVDTRSTNMVSSAGLENRPGTPQDKMSIRHSSPSPPQLPLDPEANTASKHQHFAFGHEAHFPFAQDTIKKMGSTYKVPAADTLRFKVQCTNSCTE